MNYIRVIIISNFNGPLLNFSKNTDLDGDI